MTSKEEPTVLQQPLLEGMCEDVATAVFSECRTYRYLLLRIWDKQVPPLVLVMLNPSTADELNNDPTVERCVRRARALGAGGLIVVNIFAYRSTDPEALREVADPVGPENDHYILQAITGPRFAVICAWGKDGLINGRQDAVRTLIVGAGVQVMALGLNKDGTPTHPLYIAYERQPFAWEWAGN